MTCQKRETVFHRGQLTPEVMSKVVRSARLASLDFDQMLTLLALISNIVFC